MFENIQSAIKIRIIAVLLTVHVGLICGIVSLARESFPNGWDLTTSLFLVAVLLLYGGFLMGVLFILIPLLPWLRRAQRVEHWTERLLRDLPLLLEHLPKVVATLHSLIVVWNEAKTGGVSSSKLSEKPPV